MQRSNVSGELYSNLRAQIGALKAKEGDTSKIDTKNEKLQLAKLLAGVADEFNDCSCYGSKSRISDAFHNLAKVLVNSVKKNKDVDKELDAAIDVFMELLPDTEGDNVFLF